MTRTRSGVGPDWPPPDGAYDYLTSIGWRDWAWEGLRRNENYQAEARSRGIAGDVCSRMEGGALLTRMQETVPPAEAWALLCFRGPRPYRLGSVPYLVTGGRHIRAAGAGFAA